MKYASRAGEKLEHALNYFHININGLTCADFGSSTGGFVDCLLQAGAEKVYAVETGYGVLDWKLRNDPRVVVMERTNAMHVVLPEKADFISVDVSWTKQKNILPSAFKNLKVGGKIVSLIKPHYEAGKGKINKEEIEELLRVVKTDIQNVGGKIEKLIESPVVGEKGKNKEYLALIVRGE